MPDPRPCAVCGEPFTPDKFHPDAKVCSVKCRARRDHERRQARRAGARVSMENTQTVAPLTEDEIIKRQEMASLEKRIRAETGRTRILCDLLLQSVEKVNAKDIPAYKPSTHKTTQDPETMVILLSDHHPGLVTPSYDLSVYHRRFELLIDRILSIHRIISRTIPIERVVLVSLGDNVSGQGIFPGQPWKSECHVLEQIYHYAAPELIRLIKTLLGAFPIVDTVWVPGNHGRTGKDFPETVNWDTVLAEHVATTFDNAERVTFDVEWEWYRMFNIYKKRFLAIHGSQIRSWLGIPFYGLVTKGMRWQGSIPEGGWDYLLHGHFHTPMAMPWNNFELIGNGTLVSGDDFALRELGMASTPAQQVFGVHKTHGITWRYTLDLS